MEQTSNNQKVKCNCLGEQREVVRDFCSRQDDVDLVEYVLMGYTLEKNPRATITPTISVRTRTKSGRTVSRTRIMNIVCVYCPFCGQKYPEE